MSIGFDPAVHINDRPHIITGPVGRHEEGSSRWYVDPTNSDLQYESVTHIIEDTSGAGGLVRWSSNVTAEAAVKKLDTVAAVKAEFGDEAAIKLLKAEGEILREVASQMGTYQHDVFESLILDNSIDDLPKQLQNVIVDGEKVDHDHVSQGLLNFFTDFAPIPEMAEATVVNTLHGFAGTLDFMGWFPTLRLPNGTEMGCRLIIDLKTGKHLYEKKIEDQLAAYLQSDEVWLDKLGNKAAMPEVDGVAILHLRSSYKRGYKLILMDIAQVRSVAYKRFLHRREVIRDGASTKELKGTALYEPLADGSQPPPLLEDVHHPGITRCRKALIEYGIESVTMLATYTIIEVSQIKGVGPKAVQACQAIMAEYDLAFATSEAVSV